MLFTMFFLAEYNNILMMSTLYSILFLGGWANGSVLFLCKIVFMVYMIIMVRAALPRYRYDQLMFLCWRVFLPIVLGLLYFYLGVSVYFKMFALEESLLFNEVHLRNLALSAARF